jgi:predicted mannosyl-3-phosphoglycerate phosphatase (HAD superfamily)
MAPSSSLVIFTDIEGTLCEPGTTRALADAQAALAMLAAHDTPVVIVADEGAACVLKLQRELGLRHPFISEGGAALHIPRGYFPNFHDLGHRRGDWYVLVFPQPQNGDAVRLLVSLYRAFLPEPVIVGLGDDWPDRVLLAEVDVPVIVRNPRVDQRRLKYRLPHAYVTSSAGAAGWREAVVGM